MKNLDEVQLGSKIKDKRRRTSILIRTDIEFHSLPSRADSLDSLLNRQLLAGSTRYLPDTGAVLVQTEVYYLLKSKVVSLVIELLAHLSLELYPMSGSQCRVLQVLDQRHRSLELLYSTFHVLRYFPLLVLHCGGLEGYD